MKKARDRRSHIRIRDKVLLHFREISEEEFRKTIHDYQSGAKLPWDMCNHPYFSQSLHGALKKLRDRDETLAQVLELIDQKLDSILNLLNPSEKVDDVSQYIVDISAMGIGFFSSTSLKVGQYLEMHIGLLPSHVFINCFGRVIRCAEHEGAYRVAVKFVWISESDQDRLIEHIFQRQVLQLRLRREMKEQEEAAQCIQQEDEEHSVEDN